MIANQGEFQGRDRRTSECRVENEGCLPPQIFGEGRQPSVKLRVAVRRLAARPPLLAASTFVFLLLPLLSLLRLFSLRFFGFLLLFLFRF